MPKKLTFVTIFPEFADKMYNANTYTSPEYTIYRYLLGENADLIDRLEKIKLLLNANDTFYAKDVFEGVSTGGIMNGLCRNYIIKGTGNKQKYYIELDDKRAIITYAKEWKLAIPRDTMILVYNRIRNEILKLF